MAVTVDQLNSTSQLADEDKIMLTHTDGQTETITAANFMKNGAKAIPLTRAEYDALTEKKPDTFYIITDESVSGVRVDQEFQPDSPYAQSGVAVYDALSHCVQWDNQLLSEGILFLGTCHIEWGQVTAVNTTAKQQFKRWFVNPPIVMITPSSFGGVFTNGYVWGKTNKDFSVFFTGGEDRVTFEYIAIGY